MREFLFALQRLTRVAEQTQRTLIKGLQVPVWAPPPQMIRGTLPLRSGSRAALQRARPQGPGGGSAGTCPRLVSSAPSLGTRSLGSSLRGLPEEGVHSKQCLESRADS